MATEEVDGYCYLRQVEGEFPAIRNCCVDVGSVLCEKLCINVHNHGMERDMWKKLKEQNNWRIAYEAVVAVLHSFDLVILLCRSGKYISVAMATDIAEELNASLHCHHGVKEPSDTWLKPCVVSDPYALLSKLKARLKLHTDRFGTQSYAVFGVVALQKDKSIEAVMRKAKGDQQNDVELEELNLSGIRVHKNTSENNFVQEEKEGYFPPTK